MQQRFFNEAVHRWNVKTGATRSGKTYMDYFVIPKRILNCEGKAGEIVLLGHTLGTLERNILSPMRNIWGSALVGNISGRNTVKLFGRTVWALGADKVTSVDRIRGISIAYCYGDEVATWAKPVFDMLKSRLDHEYSIFDGTCNPEGPEHWFRKFLLSDADIFQQAYTLDDNEFLPDVVKNAIKTEYAGTVLYDRYVLGLWVAAEGLVYPMFDPEKHVASPPITQRGEYYVSIDYGTMNPFSAGLWLILGQVAYRVREYYYDGRQKKRSMTDEEYYQAVEKMIDNAPVQAIIIDPSAASFIEVIRRKGRFSVRKADNDVLNGIRTTARLLNNGNLLFAPCCSDSLREFRAYLWDDSAKEKDRPIKENDHAMDDIRYFCQTVMRKRVQ